MSEFRSRVLMPALVMAATTSGIIGGLGAPLVPEVAQAENISLAAAQWSLTVTLLAGAISVPILGRLGTHRHRRSVVLVALAIAAIGAAVAALPLGFPGILVGRLLQGPGMGVVPVIIGIARNVLPPERQASALSILAVSTVAGSGLAFPLAAFFATAFGLHSAYFFGFVILVVTFLVAFYAVPAATPEGPEPPVDWIGVMLLSVGSSGLLVAVTQGDHWGWNSPQFVGVVLVGAVALFLWGRRSLKIPNPLIDLRLVARRGALTSHLLALIAGGAAYMLLSLVAVMVQSPIASGGFGQSVFVGGLMLVPYSIASLVGSRFSLILARRVPVDLILPIGCAVYVGAMLLVAFARTELWVVVVAMFVAGLGSGATFAVMPGLLLRVVAPRESGSAMSANHLLRSFGFAMGSAVVATVLTLFIPSGEVRPHPDGFTAVALGAAGLMFAAGILALVLGLRSDRRGPGPEAPEDPTALEL